MAPFDEATATVWLKSFYSSASTSFVVIGIQLFMCIYGLQVFLETSHVQRQGRKSYIVISFLILLLYTISSLGDKYQIFELLFTSKGIALEAARLRRLDDHKWWTATCSVCTNAVNWIGDGVLLYRCYIIFRENAWVCVLPASAYLASFAMSVYALISLVLSTTSAQSYRYNPNILSAWLFLSVAVNCLVTISILHKLLRLRWEVAKVLPSHQSTATLGVVAMLIESALPLSITGIAAAIVVSDTSARGIILNTVFQFLWFTFNAISPQIIIFRVTIGRSWTNKGPELSTFCAWSPEGINSQASSNIFGVSNDPGALSSDPECCDSASVEEAYKHQSLKDAAL